MSRDDEDLQRLWKAQETHVNVTIDGVALEATKFQHRIRWRNAREYVAGGVVAVAFGYFAVFLPMHWLMRVGSVMNVFAAGVILTMLRARGHAAPNEPPATAPTTEVVRFHREELVRQRDLLRSVPRWYLAPLVPGLVLWCVGDVLGRPDQGWLRALPLAIGATVVFIGVAWLNRRAARKLGEQIAELDRQAEADRVH